MNKELKILKVYEERIIHCQQVALLKWGLYDGGWGDSGAMLFFQCVDCGVVIRTRISDAKDDTTPCTL